MCDKTKYNDIVAVVMAGGRSKRMGEDKGLIKYKNKAQRYYLADLLKNIVKDVVISVPHDFEIPNNIKYRYVKDVIGDLGPLGGLYSLFKAFPEKSILIIATDMPEVCDRDIELLLKNRDSDKYITCYKNSKGFIEPLFAIWENKCSDRIEELILQNKLSLRTMINNYPSKIIDAFSDKTLININTEKEKREYLK